jgi:hypothetical protein
MTDLSHPSGKNNCDLKGDIANLLWHETDDDYPRVYEIADAILELIKGAVPVWQPIETAPKDGTPILTYSGGCDDREAYLVMWWSDDKAELCGFGWEAYEVGHMLSPNLWMPLPPAPASSQRWG